MAAFRELTEAEVTFSVTLEPEYIPIEGNAMASGDPAADQEVYDWIRAELARGNEWAWCSVKVTAEWNGYQAADYLGCCSYESEADFRAPGGYFDDMRKNALDALNENVKRALDTLQERIS
jgi:hypothetical protein